MTARSGTDPLLGLDDHVVRFTAASVSGPGPTREQVEIFLDTYLDWRARAVPDVPFERPDAADADGALVRVRRDRRSLLGSAARPVALRIFPEPPLLPRSRLARGPGGEPFLAEVVRRLEGLRPRLVRAILHGSYATGEAVRFSDLDLCLFFAEGSFDDPVAIREVRSVLWAMGPLLAAIDPLSHHGFQILGEDDLRWHPVPRFPPVLFERGRSLVGRGEPIALGLVPGDGRERLDRMVRSLESFDPSGRDATRFKDLVARILLLPTLALQAAGEEVWKGDSFARAEERWPDLDWSVVRLASRIRRRWGPVPCVLRPFPPRILGALRGLPARAVARFARDHARKRTPLPPPAFRARLQERAAAFGRALASVEGAGVAT